MFESLLTVLVWVVATTAYVSYIRDGEHGFRRVVAFVLGFPWTLCGLFIVRPSTRLAEPRHEEGAEEQALLLEIRRDRALRTLRMKSGKKDDESEKPLGDTED